MAYVTTIPDEVSLADLPHDAIAIGAGKYGAPPELIHHSHSVHPPHLPRLLRPLHLLHPVRGAALSARDIDFEWDVVGNRAGFSGGLTSEIGEQLRHLRQPKEVIRLHFLQGIGGHFGECRVLWILHNGYSPAAIERPQSGRAVSHGAGQDDADRARSAA